MRIRASVPNQLNQRASTSEPPTNHSGRVEAGGTAGSIARPVIDDTRVDDRRQLFEDESEPM